MDYDYIEDDRPRFQLAAGPIVQEDERKLDIRQVVPSAAIGFLLLGYGWMVGSSFTQFIAYWVGVALIVGPFAPISYTGGDCRVGVGEPVPSDDTTEPTSTESERRQSGRRRQETNLSRVQSKESLQAGLQKGKEDTGEEGLKSRKTVKAIDDGNANGAANGVREEEWTAADFDLLRKQMAKHPRGTARRWEVISEIFRGSHNVESVIKMAKAIAERKPDDDDSYAKFLSQRKGSKLDISSPLSKREEANGLSNVVLGVDDTHLSKEKPSEWSEDSDKALLTALKVFPKDSAMRWDKIAAAVPGKSKAQCFRRYADLRENFRGKKIVVEANSHAE